MNKIIAFLFSAILLNCSFSFAQSADEKKIAGRIETFRKLMIAPDKNGLEDIAADELSFGHSSGMIQDKTAFVDELVQGKAVFTAVVISDQTIKISDDVAIVRHHMTADTNTKNVPGKADLLVLMIWQKQKGQWKLLARQGVKAPVPAM